MVLARHSLLPGYTHWLLRQLLLFSAGLPKCRLPGKWTGDQRGTLPLLAACKLQERPPKERGKPIDIKPVVLKSQQHQSRLYSPTGKTIGDVFGIMFWIKDTSVVMGIPLRIWKKEVSFRRKIQLLRSISNGHIPISKVAYRLLVIACNLHWSDRSQVDDAN